MKCIGGYFTGLSALVLMALLSVFLVSCSTARDIFGGIVLWDEHRLADKDVSRFTSTVRPPMGSPESHYLLAGYYQERNRYKEAIEEYKKIIIIDPGHVKAYNGIGVSFDKLGYTSRAVEYYEKALSLDPDIDYVLNNLGYAYISLGEYEKAIENLKKAVALNDKNERVHNNLGLAYSGNGQYELALNEFKLAGKEAVAYYNMGRVNYKKGLYQDARNNFLMSSNLDPSFAMADKWFALAGSMDTIVKLADEDQRPDNVDEKQKSSDKKIALEHRDYYKDSGIEISNGNGVRNMAGRIADYLDRKGFDVVRLTNADSYNYARTIVYYRRGHRKNAHEIISHIPGTQTMQKAPEFDRPDINIKVLIGKDIVKYHDVLAGG